MAGYQALERVRLPEVVVEPRGIESLTSSQDHLLAWALMTFPGFSPVGRKSNSKQIDTYDGVASCSVMLDGLGLTVCLSTAYRRSFRFLTWISTHGQFETHGWGR
jgi:hypothetical protein